MPSNVAGIGPNSNMLAALPEKLVKKVLTGVANNMTDSISQHANEAVQQGVPWGHVIDQLLTHAPQTMGLKAGMGLAMPPTPPGGPNPPNGGGPPPNSPPPSGGGVTNQTQQQAPPQDNTNPYGVTPESVGQNQANPNILGQLLASMQNPGTGQQVNMPSFLGIKPSAQNQALLTQAALSQQELAGKRPMQIGDLQKLIAGVGASQLEATSVPLNAGQRMTKEYQDKEIAARTAEYQLNNAKEQMSALNQEQERVTAEFNAMASQRAGMGKFFTEPKQMIEQYKAKLDDIGNRMDKARENLKSLADGHPNLQIAKSVSAGTNSEPTATNPQTGKKLVYRGGKWQPLTK